MSTSDLAPSLIRVAKGAKSADIAAQYGFEVILKSLPDWAYRDKVQDLS